MGFNTYNYQHFSRELLNDLERAAFSGPEPGERAPDFKGVTLEGKTVRLGDFRGKKNVLLVFGSATCPMTAASVGGINRLYSHFSGEPLEFLFIYVREAHPGDQIPAHKSSDAKVRAALLLRAEENISMPVVVDDLRGSIHRKYSRLPNPAFLIDKSGYVAFRSMWTKPQQLEAAMEELLEIQRERGVNQAVVNGGQDLRVPLSYSALSSYRALERGGEQAVSDFRRAVGLRAAVQTPKSSPGKEKTAPESRSVFSDPGRILAWGALTAAVLTGGLYAGFELRKRRLGTPSNPYRAYEKDKDRDADTGTGYGAVGI